MKRLTALILASVCALSATACAPIDDIDDITTAVTDTASATVPAEITSENLMKNITADDGYTVPDDMTDGNTASTKLALELFKGSFNGTDNTLISPLSVMSALAMTANGASGDTLSETESVLGLTKDELNTYMEAYVKGLPQDEKAKLHLANSVWFKNDASFTVNDSFLQSNADHYGADIYKAPFDDTTLSDINSWVNENTHGMIPSVLDQIPSAAIMYLVNALAFEAEWQSKYYSDDVYEREFTNIDGTKAKVDMMSSTEYNYFENESSKGFLKYYDGRKYAFAAFLPNEGISIEDYVGSLTAEKLSAMLSAPQDKKVYTRLPQFEYDYDIEMSELLQSLGMKDAFDPDAADFSKLGKYEGQNIFISRVLHKTFISVTPDGTRAGAATIVETAAGAAMEVEPPKEVYLDRPFVYMIIDTENNVPFFIGAVTNLD